MSKVIVNAIELNKRFFTDDPDFKENKVMLILKDNKTNEKSVKIYEKPMRKFYILKPEYDDGHTYLSSAPKEWLEEHQCYEKSKTASIVKAINDPGLTAKYKAILEAGKTNHSVYKELNCIEQDRRVFNSDGNIVDSYIRRFNERFPDTNYRIDKGFFDIEVDGSDVYGFPDEEQAPAPVNIITYYDDSRQICYVYALKYDTDTYREAMHDNGQEIIDELNNFYNEEELNKLRMPEAKIKFIIKEYDREIDLIKAFYDQVNENKNDFISGWNSVFDNLTLKNRIKKHGIDPKDIICPPEMKYKFVYFKKSFGIDPADTYHTFDASSYSNWIDEETLYANITKPTGKRESYTLDYIGKYEVGEQKRDYDGSLKDLHLRNYRQFILYNIQDVILLAGIERKTRHIDLLCKLASTTNTRNKAVLKKTISIRNFGESNFLANGKVISNNRSFLYEGNDEPVPGAFVSDPELLENVGSENILGRKSNKIFKYATDMDANQMYPNNIIAYNICAESRVGTIKYYKNDENNNKIDMSDEFVDDYISNDGFLFSQKYYNLPSIAEMEQILLSTKVED